MKRVVRKKNAKLSFKNIRAIDLFCGAGGLTKGLEKSGIAVKLGIDIDPECEYPYTENNLAKFLLKSVKEVKVNDFEKAFKKKSIRLLAGCAPCQTFSTYNQKATSADERWWLLDEFTRLVVESKPHFVTMENVPKLEDQNVFKSFVRKLKKMKYHVTTKVVNIHEYGVPQHRRRLVLIASKYGEINLIQPEEFKNKKKSTVRICISKMPRLRAGSKNSSDPLHQAAKLSPLNYRRIKMSKPGGSWRDWDNSLQADCHKKKTGKTYRSVYGRMKWDEPAPTITTQFYGFGNGRFGHPEQNRAISLREGAILQSFPRSYKFVDPKKEINKRTIGRLIGNAVPPKLGELIGVSIKRHIESISR